MTPMSPEQNEIWERVNELWRLAQSGDLEAIRDAIHPRYVGWEAGAAAPHDREGAIRSVSSGAPRIRRFVLEPKSVEVYGTTGVAHYAFTASVQDAGERRDVRGRWTEVYAKDHGAWQLVAVQGGPDRG